MTSFFKKTIFFSIIIAGLLNLSSCDLDSSPNGKLDGYWRMVSIDTLSTDGQLNLENDLRFWSVQNKLLQLVDRQNNDKSYYLRFEHSGNKLELTDAFIDKSQSEDIPLEDIAILKYFGIQKLPVTFNVTNLSGKSMVLETQDFRLRFKRY